MKMKIVKLRITLLTYHIVMMCMDLPSIIGMVKGLAEQAFNHDKAVLR